MASCVYPDLNNPIIRDINMMDTGLLWSVVTSREKVDTLITQTLTTPHQNMDNYFFSEEFFQDIILILTKLIRF